MHYLKSLSILRIYLIYVALLCIKLRSKFFARLKYAMTKRYHIVPSHGPAAVLYALYWFLWYQFHAASQYPTNTTGNFGRRS